MEGMAVKLLVTNGRTVAAFRGCHAGSLVAHCRAEPGAVYVNVPSLLPRGFVQPCLSYFLSRRSRVAASPKSYVTNMDAASGIFAVLSMSI